VESCLCLGEARDVLNVWLLTFFPFHYEPQFSYAVKHLFVHSFLRISFDVDSCFISCLLCIFITCFFFDSAVGKCSKFDF
jgi:hypothetical protein